VTCCNPVPKDYGRAACLLVAQAGSLYTDASSGGMQMATFNRVFTTQRLVQIIVVLGATVLMKLLA
jgi:hypothetical protein